MNLQALDPRPRRCLDLGIIASYSTKFWVWDIKTIGPISSSELQKMYDSGEVKGGLCRSSADNSWLALDDFFENGKLKEKLPTMADQIRYAKYHASRADHRTFLLKTNHEGEGYTFSKFEYRYID